jgi:hypothetical protein
MYLLWHDCFEHFCLGCRFCCFIRRRRRRRRRRWWWAWWWGCNIWCLLQIWGCKFFFVFRMKRRWGCKFFRTRRRSEWNVLLMWGLRRRRRMWGTMCGRNLYCTV